MIDFQKKISINNNDRSCEPILFPSIKGNIEISKIIHNEIEWVTSSALSTFDSGSYFIGI